MKLAFYYHLEVSIKDGNIYLPSMLGVFLEDIADKVSKLYYLAHTTSYDPIKHDFKLDRGNVELIDLGAKSNAIYRLFRGCNGLDKALEVCDADILLVRAPTPLAPWLYKKFKKKMPVSFLIVGDYSTLEAPIFSASSLLYRSYELIMNRIILPKCAVLVNSHALFDKYSKIAKETHEVRTTTLRDNDFYHREDTCNNNILQLLYVGRYDWNKGIKELIISAKELKEKAYTIKLHLVGWDDSKSQQYVREIKSYIDYLEMSDDIIIDGKKNIGEDLNRMYRMADIFILPSYSEGMPRCIWEAMANGVPVVTTNVGGIPYNISETEAILIQPHNSSQITEAVAKIAGSSDLRKKLIHNAYNKAEQATLNVCNAKIIYQLRNYSKIQ